MFHMLVNIQLLYNTGLWLLVFMVSAISGVGMLYIINRYFLVVE